MRKDDVAVKTEETSNGGIGFAFGLIVGALIGAAAAILMAPQPGEKTREQLRQQAHKLRAS